MLISDIILAAACLCCYLYIGANTKHIKNMRLLKYWRLFFVIEAFSFFMGGIAHGFYLYLGNIAHLVAWYASVLGVFVFAWGILSSSRHLVPKYLNYSLVAMLIICSALSAILMQFNIIVAYCFIIMFTVIYVNYKSRIITAKTDKSKGILIGTIIFLLAAAVQIFKIKVFGVFPGVTAHIILTVGILFFGRGCLDTVLSIHEKRQLEA